MINGRSREFLINIPVWFSKKLIINQVSSLFSKRELFKKIKPQKLMWCLPLLTLGLVAPRNKTQHLENATIKQKTQKCCRAYWFTVLFFLLRQKFSLILLFCISLPNVAPQGRSKLEERKRSRSFVKLFYYLISFTKTNISMLEDKESHRLI